MKVLGTRNADGTITVVLTEAAIKKEAKVIKKEAKRHMYKDITEEQYQRLLDFRLMAKHLFRDGLITRPELSAARAPVDKARRECAVNAPRSRGST